MTIIRILEPVGNVNVQPQIARVIKVYDYNVPSGILETAFTEKGGILIGTGAGAYLEKSPGADGTFLKYDSASPSGVSEGIPSLDIQDTTNHIMNGGFWLAQRQTPGTLTAITNHKYSADRWLIERENADLQYARKDGSSETGLLSPYYGQYKKVTNSGKFLICQPLEFVDTLKFRGKTVNFQLQMKASSAKIVKIAVMELQSGGTADSIPTIVSSWNADATDPTFGTNLAVIATPASCSVTTAWQAYQFTATFPSTSKNLIVAMWTDADFADGDILSLAEAGLFFGDTLRSWTPLHVVSERYRCLRYCTRIENTELYSPYGNGMAISTTEALFLIDLPVMMRDSPTCTISGSMNVYDGVSGYACSSIVSNLMGSQRVMVKGTTSGLTQYRPYFLVANGLADGVGYILMESEL